MLMYHLKIKNNVLTKVIYSKGKEGLGWIGYCVQVPNCVTEIASNVFDESCANQVLGIILPNTIKRIAPDSFNVDMLAFILENRDNDFLVQYVANIVIKHPTRKYAINFWPMIFRN
ncbi:MAG: hypothetical protein FWE53_02360 [Firmicutes bacterium]|nr:hypothetical protein [Bacillota bacterium]